MNILEFEFRVLQSRNRSESKQTNKQTAAEYFDISRRTRIVTCHSNTHTVMAASRPDINPPPPSSQPQICRFHLSGACRFGALCFYSHDNTLSTSDNEQQPATTTTTSSPSSSSSSSIEQQQQLRPPKQPQLCKYFAMGCCHFGDQCFNVHSLATPPPPSSTSIVQRIDRSTHKLQSSTKANEYPEEEKEETKPAPQSYYEALTGKQITSALSVDADPFDADYLRRTRGNNGGASLSNRSSELCPYFECPYGGGGDDNSSPPTTTPRCPYTHGLVCDMCQQAALHPHDSAQRDSHVRECAARIERECEEAFAAQRSADKQCGICMEVVWQKEGGERAQCFGILANCNHVFCLACIRQWRASKAYENRIVKACPECRVKSDFVTPSRVWFEDAANKERIIDAYKRSLNATPCRYFREGDGRCPFGNKCFYMHRAKDGTLVHLAEPQAGRRHRLNRHGQLERFSNVVQVDFDFSDDDDDEFDLLEFFRHQLLWDHDDDDNDDDDNDTSNTDYAAIAAELFDLSAAADELFI